MRDWRAYLRENLDLPAMEGLREERIIEEIAGQLEDFYQEALERGMDEAAADAYARRSVPDWQELKALLASSNRAHRTPATAAAFERSEQAVRRRGGGGVWLADRLADVRQAFRTIRFAPAFWIVSLEILRGISSESTTPFTKRRYSGSKSLQAF